MIGVLYQKLLKPLFFSQDPEWVHDSMLLFGRLLGSNPVSRWLVSKFLNYQNSKLEQKIAGILFKNPIGLAAGFDKNARLLNILPSVGFGFAEVGSITGEPCPGNPRPRLWRLPQSRSLGVYYGLRNDGSQSIAGRLLGKRFTFPVGISLAKTNLPAFDNIPTAIEDYVKAYNAFTGIGDYFTVNVSCPNTTGGQPFMEPENLDLLLNRLDTLKTTRPVFVKISPDKTMAEVDRLLEIIGRHFVDGIICSNLTKNRNNSNIVDTHVPQKGGFSGKVVEQLANELIRHVYHQAGGKYVIVGCGGVFSAEDAYKKIRLGANLIQLITGMVYQGPQLIGEINQGLVKLLARDGYENIGEAVGRDA